MLVCVALNHPCETDRTRATEMRECLRNTIQAKATAWAHWADEGFDMESLEYGECGDPFALLAAMAREITESTEDTSFLRTLFGVSTVRSCHECGAVKDRKFHLVLGCVVSGPYASPADERLWQDTAKELCSSEKCRGETGICTEHRTSITGLGRVLFVEKWPIEEV